MEGRTNGRSIYIRCSLLFCKQSLIIAYFRKLSKTLQKETSARQSAYIPLNFESGNHPEILFVAQLVGGEKKPVFVELEVSVRFLQVLAFSIAT